MTTQINESVYKDQPAVTIESAVIAAQFLPGIGAKMASLRYKPLDLELLVQRPGAAYLRQPYDGDYVAGECSGFDDMFPTIDACFYQSYPWKGTPIPDHGEVWSLPWQCEADAGSLHMQTRGVRFPYRIEKWIAFDGERSLQWRYRLTNESPFAMDFMWAAHMMIVLEEGAEIVLPPGVNHIVNRLSFNGALGNYGDILDWPVARLPDGSERDLSRVRPPSARDADKYFVKGRMPAGWCALTYPRSGLTLTVSFSNDTVPYLGILLNEGGWGDLYNIFIEPCTASFDDLNVAKTRGECSTVAAGGVYEWTLGIQYDA